MDKIINIRKDLGLTRKQFCDLLEIKLEQLIQIEKIELELEVIKNVQD